MEGGFGVIVGKPDLVDPAVVFWPWLMVQNPILQLDPGPTFHPRRQFATNHTLTIPSSEAASMTKPPKPYRKDKGVLVGDKNGGKDDQNPYLVGSVSPPHLKNMLVKLGSSSPSFGVKLQNIWNHRLVMTFHGFYWLVNRDPYMGLITIPDITG